MTDSTVASLCLSIEASIIMLKNEDQATLSFFYLIGLLPGGIMKDDVKNIWKECDKSIGSDYHIKKLKEVSLI